jgi:hypothetical protein
VVDGGIAAARKKRLIDGGHCNGCDGFFWKSGD